MRWQWPDHDIGVITGIRYAQQSALKLPKVGMVVTVRAAALSDFEKRRRPEEAKEAVVHRLTSEILQEPPIRFIRRGSRRMRGVRLSSQRTL